MAFLLAWIVALCCFVTQAHWMPCRPTRAARRLQPSDLCTCFSVTVRRSRACIMCCWRRCSEEHGRVARELASRQLALLNAIKTESS